MSTPFFLVGPLKKFSFIYNFAIQVLDKIAFIFNYSTPSHFPMQAAAEKVVKKKKSNFITQNQILLLFCSS